jgi:predicted nucleic acid-binding protein
MIAADTSTWVAYLQGHRAEDTNLLDRELAGKQVLMPPAVLTELLSDPKLPAHVAEMLAMLPLIDVEPGYRHRAAKMRSKAVAKRRKARLGNALIAQSCMDRGIPLATRDRDFKAFAEAENLDLVIGFPAE